MQRHKIICVIRVPDVRISIVHTDNKLTIFQTNILDGSGSSVNTLECMARHSFCINQKARVAPLA